MKDFLPVSGKVLGLFFLSLFLFLNVSLSFAQSEATVTTDKEDYVPGEYVIITGTGWLPGETVDFVFEETPKPESCVNSHDHSVEADLNGNIYYDQFLIKENHIGVSFVLTATGTTSGFEAQTTFTDGNLKIDTNSGSASISFIKYDAANCSGSILNSGSGNINTGTTNDTYQAVGENQSIKLTAPSTNNLGQTFSSWTSSNGTATFSIVGGDNKVICVEGTKGNGAIKLEVNYNISCTQPTVNSVNSCIGGGNVTFTQTGGNSGGTWSVSGGGTINSSGVFTPDTIAGCFTATYQTPSGNCQDTKSFVVFPAAPPAPAVNSGCGAITVTPPSSISGFNIQYSFDDGATWGANNPPTADNCDGYKIRTRYTLAAACGSTAAGSVSANSACAASPAITRVVDTTAPSLSGTPYSDTTDYNACEADAQASVPAFSEASAIEGYSDNCGGSVTASLTNTETTGTDCSWTVTYTYTVSDSCGNELPGQTYTHSGNDQDAPTGVTPSEVTGINACADETEIDGLYPTADDETALETAYTDDCGTVTATFVSQTLSGDSCSWSLDRTYTISDGCSGNNFDVVMTYSGSDQDAPTGVTPSEVTGINACADETEIDGLYPTADDETALETAYTDDCVTVTATFVSQTLSGDSCSWSLDRTYTISDGCSGNNFDVVMTYSGSDQDAPTGVTPSEVTGINACADETEIDGLYPTADDETALETAYTDDCGTVTATFVSQTLSGDSCSWSLDRTYTISDGCSGNNFDVVMTYSGSDQDAPTGVTPSEVTGINACADETEIDGLYPTADDETALETAYTDDCGTVTATFVSQTLSGDSCSWSLDRTYTISDGCSGNNFDVVMTYSGSDQDAPTGVTPSEVTGINACADETEIDGLYPTADDETALETAYTDDCGTVTATFVSQTLSGDSCSWSLDRTYTISDGCSGNNFDVVMTYSGSDQDAPTGVTPSEVTGINACADETEIDGLYPTADDETALETAYTDDCGTVTATFVSQTLSGDSCSWSLDRTYTISDGCSGNNFDVVMTYSGSDQDAPTGVTPSEVTGINACADETEIDGLYPTADDETALETAYTDDCGTVTATFVSQTLSGDSCSWSLDRTYTISDGCSGNNFDVVMTYSGSDQDAPTGVTPSEVTGINACADETEIDSLYPTADDETALETAYTDDCGTVTATFVSQTLSGDSCSWSLDRTYTISDGCSGNNFDVVMTYSGSDQDAPTGVTPSEVTGINACADETEIDGLYPTADDETALETAYTDDCGTVTATFVSQTLSGDSCSWSLDRTYTISDGCSGNNFDVVMTYSGSDQDAPTGVTPSEVTGINACADETEIDGLYPTADDETALETAYTDDCGTVTATFVSQTLSGDSCSWSLDRTYTISDGCSGNNFDVVMTYSGSDQDAPTGVTPSEVTGINACADETEIDGLYPTADDETALETAYTDDCGTVTATFVSQTLSGDSCSWSLDRTYTISDGCSGNNFDVVMTYSGSDQDAPTGVTPSEVTGINACADETEIDGLYPTADDETALETAYTDDCGTVTATFVSQTLSGDSCSWSLDRTYTISDGCSGNNFDVVMTYSGSDQDAPTGVTPSEVTGINACADETEIDGLYPTADDETALETAYTDDCGTVTATFVSQTLSGDSCSWSLDRTYTISDGCSGNNFDVVMTYSGSDQDAPTGVTPSEVTGINACADETEIDGLYPTADDETALETAYTDDCGTVTATFVSQTLSGDSCSWSLDRTYTISDGCSGNNFDVVMTYSGSDQDAPTGVTPSEVTGINACADETEIDGLYPTADDETALETAYTDDCGTVTATFVSQTLSGDSCSWSLDRTYTISDGCSGNNFDVVMTYSGSDQDAPTGVTPSEVTGINACADETEIDGLYPTADDETALETAYTDDCGTVTATFVSQTLSGDSCSWSLDRTYTISDGCSGNNFDVVMTYSGSDQDAPTGVTPSEVTGINACADETEIDGLYPTADDETALETAYTDDCGTVTATFVSQTLSGDSCSWSLDRTYTISDGCSGNNFDVVMTYSGSDQDAPTGVTPSEVTGINACADETEIDGLYPTADDETALETAYTDDCGTVTATFVSQTLSGDSCSWSLDRTYTISDGCSGNNFDVVMTYSGSDQDAPTGVTPSEVTGINACADETEIDGLYPTADDETALETAYTDDCGTVTATFVSQTLSGDSCSWSLDRTYTISDGCSGNNFDVVMTYSGSDQDAPTGVTPSEVTGINACADETEIDGLYPTADDETALETAYTDDCGTVTATFVSQTLSGDSCSWSLDRTYTISDGCSGNNFDVVMTYSGSDQDAPTGVTPSEVTGINACADETEIDGLYPTADDETALETAYTDDCGTVTATFVSQTLSGDSCSWSLDRTYTISDGCSGNNFDVVMTYSGSDQDAPTGVTPSEVTGINACADETEIDGLYPTADDETALETAYTDDCGTVTATFVSQTLSGDSCSWSLDRTYTISDGCSGNNFDVVMTYSGSDQDAPTGVTPSEVTGINACADETEIDGLYPTADDETALETAYTDDCGTVTATFVSQTLSGDSCSWSLDRTYTISDGCSGNNFDVVMTYSGSDQDAPTGVTPSEVTGINACADETEIDGLYPTADDETALETAYTDDCGTVTATFVSQTLSGDSCSWSLDRTYTISDGCSGNNFDVVMTYSGSDQDAPTGVTPSEVTGINACADETEIDGLYPTADDETALETAYTDDCGTVTATFVSQTLSGDSCSWSLDRTYTISDGCSGNNFDVVMTYSGSDQDAPTGVTPSEVTGINACADETEIDGLYPTADDETALETAYTDDCGTVTATFVSQTLSGDSCSWSLDRTYTISDGCSGNNFDVVMTYSGSDQDAPTGVTPSEVTGINACADETEIDGLYPTADDETALETAYTDDCGTVTATFVSQTLSGDSCSWSLDRTYTISDGCSGNNFDVVMTYSGSDQDAPTGVTPSEVTGINACADETEIDGLYPTADDETALETAYTDDCGTVTATFVSQTLSGDSCSWSLDRTYTISDGCSGNNFDVVMTYSGSDQDAPTGVTPSEVTGINACADETEIDGLYPTADDETALETAYTDDCGTVTATFVSQTLSGDSCSWSLDRTYTISDGCSGNNFDVVMTYSGSDQDAPTGVTPSEVTGINACADETEIDGLYPTADDETALETAYTDDCGTVTATFVSQTLSGDSCSWSLDRTYTISDGCSGNNFDVVMTYSGSDQDAPTGVTPSEVTGINACADETEIDGLYPTADDETALETAYTDDCGTVTATFVSQTLSGDSCSWSLDRTYTISDGCSGNNFDVVMTYSGSDQDAPTGVTPSEVTGINACADETEIDGLYPTADDETALETAYTDDCGTVTATFVSQTLSGDSCSWSLDRTYTISDGCSGNNFDVVMTYSGSDQDAPTGVTPSEVTGINACADETEIDGLYPTADDETALETAYTDDCGTVTATFVSQTLSGDSCSWSLDRTYTISDGCSGNNFDVVMTYSGSDQDAPTGVTPSEVTGINACADETEIDGLYPTADDETALETAYTDDCGTVTATFVSQTLSGDSCSWSLDRTYTISDGCSGNNFDVVMTYSGSDQDAPTGVTPSEVTGINACADETEIDGLYPTADDETALETAYTDDCGTVTATFVSQTLSGDSCSWSLDRTYTISDGCSGNNFDVVMTYSGSDQDAPTGVTPSEVTGINACADETEIDGLYPTADDETALETAYTDDCGTVTATFVSQTLSGNSCSWSLDRTYTISDGCSGNNFDVVMTYSGSDQDAPTGVTPSEVTGINACADETEIDGLYPTADDETALETAYTDDCGTVTATFVSQTLSGNSCSWSLDRTYTISDGCSGNDFNVTMTYSGSDQDAPILTNLVIPTDPQQIGSTFELSAAYSDCSIVTGVFSLTNGSIIVPPIEAEVSNGKISLSELDASNLEPGVYTVSLTATDDCLNSITVTYPDFLVIYDPSGGFVTGGGWFYSEPEYLIDNPDNSEGKANFGFNAKYKSGRNNTTEVDGHTNFQFKEGDFHFKSSSHEDMSLVISGGFKATYTGVGTINNDPTLYNFRVTVIDAEKTPAHDTDLFRIKIWDGGTTIYDNNINSNTSENADPSTAIDGGSIVIHKPKGNKKTTESSEKTDTQRTEPAPENLNSLEVAPNPMVTYTDIRFSLKAKLKADLFIFDMRGRQLRTLHSAVVDENDVIQVRFDRGSLPSGVYICKLVTGDGRSYERQIVID